MDHKKYITIIILIVYYFLILCCCLGGVYLAGKEGFVRETIFLIYVSMTVYAIVEIIFRHISFLNNKVVILRVLFLVVCIISTYSLLRTTDEMILKKELNSSPDTLNIVDISLEPRIGYLVNIKFKISKEQLLDLVDVLGFTKTDLTEFTFNFNNSPMRELQERLIREEKKVLTFEKNEDRPYAGYGTRYLIYDIETMNVYYSYENHKGIN